MVNERWLPIPGYEGYEASDLGRIRSLDRLILATNGRSRRMKGRVLRPWLEQGYPCVEIAYKSQMVHRLVLLAFVGPRPAGMLSRHLNDVKSDSRLVNLTYGTDSDNKIDAVRNGIDPQANRTHCPKNHPYAGSNLIVLANGHRRCRECRREQGRAYEAKRPPRIHRRKNHRVACDPARAIAALHNHKPK